MLCQIQYVLDLIHIKPDIPKSNKGEYIQVCSVLKTLLPALKISTAYS